jgi:mediator of RNA polymerase II transcription subunit 12
MNPHPSAGSWGHPLRTFNGVPGRIDNVMGYDTPSFPPTRHVVDLTAGGPESQDREPPPKRPRLQVPGANAPETAPTETRNTPGSASSRPAISWRGRPLWSFQAVIADLPNNDNRNDSTTASKPPSPPPLPAQPWKTPAVAEPQGPALIKSRESSPVGAVQTTPYRIETPAAAPAYKGNSE